MVSLPSTAGGRTGYSLPSTRRPERLAEVRQSVAALPDPEIPVITIEELGILRGVDIDGDVVTVIITPTYSGCPAMDQIRADIETVVRRHGLEPAVELVYAPAWTTDWMTDGAREKLLAFGIAPPRGPAGAIELGPVMCPQCAGETTTVVSRFASTACKALLVCRSCGEPFDHFKEH